VSPDALVQAAAVGLHSTMLRHSASAVNDSLSESTVARANSGTPVDHPLRGAERTSSASVGCSDPAADVGVTPTFVITPPTLRRVTGIRLRPESLLVGALLAGVGGYLDAYTYVGHRVFANAQTGNVVLFAFYAANGLWREAGARILPVLGFLVGIVLAETLGRPRSRVLLRRPLRVALGLEIVIVAGVAALPRSAPVLLVTVPIGVAAAIQFATFRTVITTPYTSLMTTGNLRTATSAAYKWLADRDPEAAQHVRRLAGVISAFVIGAVLGAILTDRLGPPAGGVAAGALLLTMIILIRETHVLEARAAAG
jgi:uncharacterized membrane protein YoaK (UPF0700 family)